MRGGVGSQASECCSCTLWWQAGCWGGAHTFWAQPVMWPPSEGGALWTTLKQQRRAPFFLGSQSTPSPERKEAGQNYQRQVTRSWEEVRVLEMSQPELPLGRRWGG
jgi:hypothetical protein